MAAQVVDSVQVGNLDEDKEHLAWFRDVNGHLPIIRQPALGDTLAHKELWRRALKLQVAIAVGEVNTI